MTRHGSSHSGDIREDRRHVWSPRIAGSAGRQINFATGRKVGDESPHVRLAQTRWFGAHDALGQSPPVNFEMGLARTVTGLLSETCV